LGAIAAERGQTLAQMAISWLLAQDVTSVIIGASSVKQLDDNLQAINNLQFTEEEMRLIR
jgi:L-glyceraldehyde 3-phosphate reductase